jgi:hypothetical protein
MALDFHRLDNDEYLFGIDGEHYTCLLPILKTFNQWTGLEVDQYKDVQLTKENCQTLLKIIDNYILETDLNRDKKKTSAILEFKGLLKYFISKDINFALYGD